MGRWRPVRANRPWRAPGPVAATIHPRYAQRAARGAPQSRRALRSFKHQVQAKGSHLFVATPDVVAQDAIGLIGAPEDDAAVVPHDEARSSGLQVVDDRVQVVRSESAGD